MTKELNENEKQALEALTSIAKLLPDEKRREMHQKFLTDELNSFITKMHYINALFGGVSDSIKIGVTVGEIYYEVFVNTKEFESSDEAESHAQARGAELTAQT